MVIKKFVFNPFQENTYLLYDETGDCIIIDPGCYTKEEKEEIADFISTEKLTPKEIILTHAHIDHVLGNNFLTGRYHIPIRMSKIEVPLLHSAKVYGEMWGIEVEASPEPEHFIMEGENITFGKTTLEVLYTPGHSPGSMSFLDRNGKNLIAGDVLFRESIGRTDLPGGDYDTLIKSIKENIFRLSDDIQVYSGHGPETTIGYEKKHNPFLR